MQRCQLFSESELGVSQRDAAAVGSELGSTPGVLVLPVGSQPQLHLSSYWNAAGVITPTQCGSICGTRGVPRWKRCWSTALWCAHFTDGEAEVEHWGRKYFLFLCISAFLYTGIDLKLILMSFMCM